MVNSKLVRNVEHGELGGPRFANSQLVDGGAERNDRRDGVFAIHRVGGEPLHVDSIDHVLLVGREGQPVEGKGEGAQHKNAHLAEVCEMTLHVMKEFF